MSNGTSGGTIIPGEIDFDAIGRALVLALLSPGAGDGPDQSTVRDAGHYFGQSLGLVFDLLVEAQVAATQEDAVRAVLALPADDYPTSADLVSAAAAVLALKVRDGTVALGEAADSGPVRRSGRAAARSAGPSAAPEAGVQRPLARLGGRCRTRSSSWTHASPTAKATTCAPGIAAPSGRPRSRLPGSSPT